MVALLATVSCQEISPESHPGEVPAGVPSFVPPQVPRPHKVSGTPLTVDAGEFAQVDLQPNGGPLRVGGSSEGNGRL